MKLVPFFQFLIFVLLPCIYCCYPISYGFSWRRVSSIADSELLPKIYWVTKCSSILVATCVVDKDLESSCAIANTHGFPSVQSRRHYNVFLSSSVSDSHSVSPGYNSLDWASTEDRVKGKSPRGRFMNSCLKSGYLTLLYYWLLHQWCSYQEMVYCTDLNLPIKLKAIVILFQTDQRLVWIIRNKYLVTPLTYLASHLCWIRRLHHVQHLRYKSSWRERILPPTKGNNQSVRKCKRLCQSSRRIVQGRARVSGKLQQFKFVLNKHAFLYHSSTNDHVFYHWTRR